MTTLGSMSRCVLELRSPDGRLRDEAARQIWEQYSPRLGRLVRRHLDSRILQREDEHDILQSMFANFCHSQSMGKTAPTSRQELWRLLVRITMCKVVNTAHRHMAGRRDVRKERADRHGDFACGRESRGVSDQVDRSQSSPEENVAAMEEVNRLLELLPKESRQIVVWRLEGFTNVEIADMMGRSVRLVEMKLQDVRERLEGKVHRGRMAL